MKLFRQQDKIWLISTIIIFLGQDPMTELVEAIDSGNLEEVKRKYLRDNSSLNTEHEFYKRRPIDFAAENAHLAILDYLIKQGASLSTNPTRPSILYGFMNAVNGKSKLEILEWVQSNQVALLASDPTLTSDHLKAFLGEEADWNSRQEHGGLFPFHYGILSDNPYAKKGLIYFSEQPFPQNGWFKSYSFPFLLAENYRWDLLKELGHNTLIDLNWELPVEHPDFGMTVAWQLASQSQWDLLKELATKNSDIALNAGPKHKQHDNYDVTLAYLLANDEQWALLQELAAKSETINLDAGSKNEEDDCYGVTLAYLLAGNEQWALLEELARKSDRINLEAGSQSEQHDESGVTLAYLLAFKKRWDLLRELGAKSVAINLEASFKNEQHINHGVTLAYLLAGNEQWALLEELARESDRINLEAGPQSEQHDNYGVTLAYLLAFDKRWTLLKALAAKIETINLEAGPKNEKDDNYGMSLAYLLAFDKRWTLLKALAAKSETINLEAGPKNEQHAYYGMTLAYWLAEDQEWDLLENLAIKSETINLEAGPKNEKDDNYGMTLAYVLAFDKRWDLLEELAAKSETINVEAGSKNEQHDDYGITLAYVLACNEQWDLLKAMAAKGETINLDAGPKNEKNDDYGKTVSWFLAHYNQWDLLDNLVTKSPPITVSAGCKTKEGVKKFGEKDFLSLLVAAEQWRLLERIIESNLQVRDIDENAYLIALNSLCNNPTFNQLVFYYQVKEKEREINKLIIVFHSVCETLECLQEKTSYIRHGLVKLENSLVEYSRLLANFSPEDVYYKKAMDSKMHLLIEFGVSNIHEAFLDTVLKVFPSPQTFSEIEGKREQVKFLIIDAALQAGNHAYILQATASQLKEIRTLKLEALEQKTSKEEAPFNATISNSLPTQIPSPRLALKGSKRDFNSVFFSTADLSDGESVKMLKQENLDEVENRADLDSESQRLPSPCL